MKTEKCDLGVNAKDVNVKEQHSKNDCDKGDTFYLEDNGRTLVVTKGCRAEFEIEF